jgi:hypothetical protein
MDIHFNCPRCGQKLSVEERGVGMLVNCPSCNEEIEIPRYAGAEAPKLSIPAIGQMSESGGSPLKGNSMTPPNYSMEGVQDLLEVYSDKVSITPKGILAFFNKGLKGTKTIPFTSITAIQFKEADLLTNGFLQFTIPGGNESRGGIFAAVSDENSFMFRPGNDGNKRASEIKDYIEAKVQDTHPSRQTAMSGLPEELQKLAGLKAQGVLSDAEFDAAKKRLLS